MFCTHVCLMHAVPVETRRGIKSPETQVTVATSYHVGARNTSWILWKSNQ